MPNTRSSNVCRHTSLLIGSLQESGLSRFMPSLAPTATEFGPDMSLMGRSPGPFSIRWLSRVGMQPTGSG